MEYWLSPTFISLASGFIVAITAYIVLLAIKPLDLESDDEVSSSLSIFTSRKAGQHVLLVQWGGEDI